MCVFAAAALPGAISAGAALSGAGAVSGIASGAAVASGLSAFQIGSLALSAIGTGLNMFSGYQQATGQAAQANAAAKIAKNNQTVANWQANDAIERGNQAEIENRRKYAQLAGTQRASFASRGVDLGEGSVLAQLDDTAIFSNIDSNTIRENASREAWGFRNQGLSYGADAAMQRQAASGYSPLFAAGSTLLTGAGDVADKWYRYGQTLVPRKPVSL